LLGMVAAILQNHYNFQYGKRAVTVSCGLWLKYRLIPFFATQLMK
jgi:hypothetical protein